MPGSLQGSSVSDPDGVHPKPHLAVEIGAGTVLDSCEDQWFVVSNDSKTEDALLFVL